MFVRFTRPGGFSAVLAAVVAMGITMAPRRAPADICQSYRESLELVLDQVTVDGAPVAADAYQGVAVTLTGDFVKATWTATDPAGSTSQVLLGQAR